MQPVQNVHIKRPQSIDRYTSCKLQNASRILRKLRKLKRALKLWRSGLVHRENRETPLSRP